MHRQRIDAVTAAMVVTVLGLLAYAPFLGQLGFYWDDWFHLFVARTEGSAGLYANMAIDRPVTGAVYAIDHHLVSWNALPQHLFAFGLRAGGALAVLWGFRGLWPAEQFLTTTISALFLVYPGFTMQPVAYSYQPYHLALSLGALSIAFTLRSGTSASPGWRLGYSAAGVATAAASIFMIESYLGLEATRVGALWLLAMREAAGVPRVQLRLVARRYAPYVIVVATFLIWRTFILDVTRQATNFGLALEGHLRNPIEALLRFPVELWRDVLESTGFAWFTSAAVNGADVSPMVFVGTQIFAFAAIGIMLGYAAWLRRRGAEGGENLAWQLLVLGVPGVLATPIVPLFGRRHIRLISLLDRYTLPIILAAVLVLVALVWLTVRRERRSWIVAGLAGLAVMAHLANADVYVRSSEQQRQLWWQLTWRAPALRPGSTILVQNPNPTNSADSQQEIAPQANLVYVDSAGGRLYGASYLTSDTLRRLQDGNVTYEYTSGLLSFPIDLSSAIVVAPPLDQACLRVLDARRSELPLRAEGWLMAAAPYSDTSRIVAAGEHVRPPSEFFGPEPARGWCFAFQRAELARQMSQWAEVARLADSALTEGLEPSDPTEWLVFIEGYARAGRQDRAVALARQIQTRQPAMKLPICRTLSSDSLARPADSGLGTAEALGCPPS